MGNGASFVQFADEELRKPLDASDIKTVEDAKIEIRRLRTCLSEYSKTEEARSQHLNFSVEGEGKEELSSSAMAPFEETKPAALIDEISNWDIEVSKQQQHSGDKAQNKQPTNPKRRKRRKACSGWKRPNQQTRLFAAKLSSKEKTIPCEFQPSPDGCFDPISFPELGDWLDEHNEKGQTFSAFQRQSMRSAPHGHVKVIELIPIGPFQEGVAPSLDALQCYTAAFFGCDCRVANAIKVGTVADNARCGQEGQLQLCCNTIFEVLGKKKSARDVLCRVAVTMIDLYPIKDGEAWNFVFGQACAMDGVGVFSFARYQPGGSYAVPWIGDVSKGNYDRNLRASDSPQNQSMNQQDTSLLLFRSCKVLTHETGHLFGIRHCIYYECLMSGCNHLEEFDKRPLYLCPVDLRKLQSASGFSVISRYKQLLDLSIQYGWSKNAQWIQSRIVFLSNNPKSTP